MNDASTPLICAFTMGCISIMVTGSSAILAILQPAPMAMPAHSAGARMIDIFPPARHFPARLFKRTPQDPLGIPSGSPRAPSLAQSCGAIRDGSGPGLVPHMLELLLLRALEDRLAFF